MWANKAAGQGMARDSSSMSCNPEECEVCMNRFDKALQRPRSLPCGHTFCGLCISMLTRGVHITCPSCSVKHVVPAGGQFPINFTLESIIATQRCAQDATGPSNQTRSLLKEQEAKIMAAISSCEQAHLQLSQYEASLEGWGGQQQILEGKIQKIMNHNRKAKDVVQQEKIRAAIRKEEVKQRQQELCVALDTLQMVTTEQEAGVAFLDGIRCTDEAQMKVEECQGVLFDDSAATTKEVMDLSRKVLNSIQNLEVLYESSLNKAASTDKVLCDGQVNHTNSFSLHGAGSSSAVSRPPPAQQSTITRGLLGMLISSQPTNLKGEDVRSLKEPARSLLAAGRVFAVHTVKGQWKCAKITLSGSSVYLHSLHDQTLPAGAATVQMSEFLPLVPPCLVFLELVWPGSAPRRVCIRFTSDTTRARQFVLLCTGQWGSSYMGTKLWAVEDKGRPVERVKGGDYERNDGKGGAALLPGLDEGPYQNSVRAGSVWGCGWSDPTRGAQFAISTRQRTDRSVWPGVFGDVVQGLDVIAAAAHHRNIREVTVVDCGVVLRE